MKYEITRGSEKDFEQAPEWAMVLLKHENGLCVFAESKSKGAKRTDIYSTGYCIILAPSEYKIIAERRPITEPVWDGEGLPPVGVECEFSTCTNDYSEWMKCTVRYTSPYTIIVGINAVDGKCEVIKHPCNMRFRPSRSPEDVARDEEIVLLTDVICGKMPDVGMATAAMFAGRVYDAGYRRPEPHADEVVACKHESTRTSVGGCICNNCGWRSW